MIVLDGTHAVKKIVCIHTLLAGNLQVDNLQPFVGAGDEHLLAFDHDCSRLLSSTSSRLCGLEYFEHQPVLG